MKKLCHCHPMYIDVAAACGSKYSKISNVLARGRHAVWFCRRIQW